MVPEKITVSDKLYLSPITDNDKEAYLEHLKEKEISEMTLRIPYPYTEKDAEKWIRVNKDLREQELVANWAIRLNGEDLIGGVGFAPPFKPGLIHASEIGCWLAKPHWNKGIMTEVITRLCQRAFDDFGLVRITGHVFSFNSAACKVMEKCGFELEGTLKKYLIKHGQMLDVKLYAKVV